jgi:uncharacterized protein
MSRYLMLLAAFALILGCNSTNLPNPASKYCLDNGGSLEMVANENGTQGICTLADGKKCDEWAYYRGECGKCGECPQFSPPAPGWCSDGRIIPGKTDECGCTGHPTCEPVACTADAKLCPDGSAVGRIGPDCEFAPCPDEKHYCSPESRKAEVCPTLYQPVCGWFSADIKCFAYPCAANAANSCIACMNENVEYWTEGECPRP